MNEEVITKELFEDLVRTAQMELTPAEAEELRAAMNGQMSIIRQLESIPLPDHIQPVIHGNPYPREIQADMREDVWTPFENIEGILAQAPRSLDGYIVSPDVPHQKLG